MSMFRKTAAAITIVAVAADFEEAFEKFKQDFEKPNADKWKFKMTYDYIQTENAKDNKYELGINEFSDMTPDEFASSHFGYKMPEKPWGTLKNLGTHVHNGEPLADSIDWTTKGAVTKVKNQGQCGSCWSFSTTGSLEGALEIASGKLTSLSEEMLVDCSTQNHACQGGSMDLAFQFVEKNGLCTEDSYPYKAGGGKKEKCQETSCTKGLTAGQVTGFHDVSQSEKSLMSALMKGPVSIAVEADKGVFQSYKNGVMTGMCGTQLDHGILVVGYGTLSGTDYWKVKNSWGTVWGQAGFGNLERGKNSKGECGILMGATYPVVKGSTLSDTAGSHYEDPKSGCQSDELKIQVQGVKGAFCSPSCSILKRCPTDFPTGVTAKPQCALQDAASKKKYCALICTPSEQLANQCGANASCKSIQGTGICTYDDDTVVTQVAFTGVDVIV